MSSIDAVPNWEIRFFLWQGRPYVIKSATQSTSSVATLPTTARDLKRPADSLGLKPLQHPSQGHRRTNSAELVITTRSVTLTCGRMTALGKYNPPSNEWISAAVAGKEAVLVIVAGDPTRFETFNGLIDWLVDTGRGFAARIRVNDLRSVDPQLSHYEFIDSHGAVHTTVSPNSSILLDADIMLDLEKAARGRITNADVLDSLADLYGTLRTCDVIPGYAISQLAWDQKRGAVKTERRIELLAAMSTWANLPVAKYRNSVALKRRSDMTVQSMRAQSGVHDKSTHDVRDDYLVLMGYAAMLKTATLWHPMQHKKFDAASRVDAYLALVDFLNQDAVRASAYPFALCRALLVGKESPDNKARSFFSFSRGIDGIYGTAWDLYFLFMLDYATTGQLENTNHGHTYLLTKDKKLKLFKTNSMLAGLSVVDETPSAVIRNTIDLSNSITSRQLERIDAAESKLWVDAHLRTFRAVQPEFEILLQIVRSLEYQVDTLFPGK